MKKRVFGVLAILSFLGVLGAVGNVEQDQIGLIPGMAIAFVFEGLFAMFAKLAGAFDPPVWEDEDEWGEYW